MYPVLAQQEIQIAELNRRQRLAAAERNRLIVTGIAAEGGGAVSSTTRRFRGLLSGMVAGLSLFRAHCGVAIREESTAIRSA